MCQMNLGVRSLKMVTMAEHVGVKELKKTLILKLCIFWCYQSFSVSKCTERTMKKPK